MKRLALLRCSVLAVTLACAAEAAGRAQAESHVGVYLTGVATSGSAVDAEQTFVTAGALTQSHVTDAKTGSSVVCGETAGYRLAGWSLLAVEADAYHAGGRGARPIGPLGRRDDALEASRMCTYAETARAAHASPNSSTTGVLVVASAGPEDPPAVSPGQVVVARAPLYRIGDEWRWSGSFWMTRTFRVTAVDDAGVTTACTGNCGGVHYHWGPDLTLARVRDSRGSDIAHNLLGVQLLRFPLHVGAAWTSTQTFRPDPTPYLNRFTVEVFEEVVTKAGTFSAFRIQRTRESSAPRGSAVPHRDTYWYSPAVKQIIKTVDHDNRGLGTTELLSYVFPSGAGHVDLVSELDESPRAARPNQDAASLGGLVGVWQGEADLGGSNRSRTLSISAATVEAEQPTIAAVYGISGRRLTTIVVACEVAHGKTHLRFVTPASSTVELVWEGGDLLSGTIRLKDAKTPKRMVLRRVQ